MREFAVPVIRVPDPSRTVPDVVVRNAAEAPGHVQFSRPDGSGGWRDVTTADFLAEVTAVAKGLVASGVAPGDRVGLLATTRYEWTLVDVAVWFAGAVTVPIYETSSAEQVRWILADSGAVACVVESPAHLATVQSVRDGLPALKEVWVLEADAVGTLREAGAGVGDDELTERRAGMGADSVATLIYTSGTTGRPKGCELTQGNFVALAENAEAVFGDVVGEDSSTLLFLPLAHVFARFIQVLAIVTRSRLGHTSSTKELVADLGTFRPTFVLAVPRVFEKIYNSAEAKAEAGGKGGIFRRATDTAIRWSESLDEGGPGLRLRAEHALFDRLVYRTLRQAVGGEIKYAVSGGAPLGVRLGHFFRGAGITILEGWGLTETTAPATVNTPTHQRIGTVGRPLPGVAVRVADDGELQVRGINVMRGYVGNPGATAEVLDDDGWFSTGDLGEIDGDGDVRITGRKKEIIVTAGGKNVAPAQMEDRLRAHPLVSQCMVVGDGRPFVAALVTLDAEMLGTWLANRGKPAMDVPAAAQDPDVRAELQKAVDDVNATVSRAESVRRFEVLDEDWTEESGHLTPKQSIKRAVVMKDQADRIEAIYRA